MAALKLPVFWSSRKLTSLRGTSASALTPLTIFHSLSALQLWGNCTQPGHPQQQSRRRCLPAQHRSAALTSASYTYFFIVLLFWVEYTRFYPEKKCPPLIFQARSNCVNCVNLNFWLQPRHNGHPRHGNVHTPLHSCQLGPYLTVEQSTWPIVVAFPRRVASKYRSLQKWPIFIGIYAVTCQKKNPQEFQILRLVSTRSHHPLLSSYVWYTIYTGRSVACIA